MLDWKLEWHDLLCGCNVQIWCNVDRFYIVLFSALKQTHCASVWFYMYEWLAFYSEFLNILWSGVLTVLTVLTCGTAAFSAWSVYTIQPCTMSLHAQPHMQGVYMFSCNLPPVLLAEWLGSFMFYCGNMVVERLQKRVQKVDSREKKISCCSCGDSNTRSFNRMFGTLTTELSPTPLWSTVWL